MFWMKDKRDCSFPSRCWEGWLDLPLFGPIIHESYEETIPVIGWFKRGAEKTSFMLRIWYAVLFIGAIWILWVVIEYFVGHPKYTISTGGKVAKGAAETGTKLAGTAVAAKSGGKGIK